jgi:hypothetical protein
MWIDAKGSTVLPMHECERLLAVKAKEGGVGRLGVPTDQAPVLVPVNFTMNDGEVIVRVGPGFLSRTAAGRLVAFEIDHIETEGGSAWSVLLRGLATLVERPSQSDFETAPRPLVHEPGDMLLHIRPDVVTGRRFTIVDSGCR